MRLHEAEKTPAKRHSWWYMVWAGVAFFACAVPTAYAVDYYTTWKGIGDPHPENFQITTPDPAQAHRWLIQTPHTFTCNTTGDADCHFQTVGGVLKHYIVSDNIRYVWSSSGGGTWPYTNIGQSRTYWCPNSAATVTITVSADDVGSPIYATDSPLQSSNQVTVTVLEPVVVAVSFSGHTIYKTPADTDSAETVGYLNNLDGWDTPVGNELIPLPNPQYDSIFSEFAPLNVPVSWTKNSSSHSVHTYVATTQTLTDVAATFMIAGKADGDNPVNWPEGNSSIEVGNWLSDDAVLYQPESWTVDNTIGSYDSFGFKWTYRCPGGLNVEKEIGTTQHKIYRIWGAPHTDVATLRRLDWVAMQLEGLGELLDMADALKDALYTRLWPDHFGVANYDLWLVMSLAENTETDCAGGRDLAISFLNILGVSAGLTGIDGAYASTDHTEYPPYYDSDCSDREDRGSGNYRYLMFGGPGPVGQYNTGESLFKVYVASDWNYFSVFPAHGPYVGGGGDKRLSALYACMCHMIYDLFLDQRYCADGGTPDPEGDSYPLPGP